MTYAALRDRKFVDSLLEGSGFELPVPRHNELCVAAPLHGWGARARLRRVIPDPVVEINPATAASHQIEQDEWVSISTPRGSVRARAHLNASLADGVIGGQHGWWQSCPDLGLPGYDPLGSEGANINLVIGEEILDPVSGAAPHRCYPCQIQKLAN